MGLLPDLSYQVTIAADKSSNGYQDQPGQRSISVISLFSHGFLLAICCLEMAIVCRVLVFNEPRRAHSYQSANSQNSTGYNNYATRTLKPMPLVRHDAYTQERDNCRRCY